MTAALDSKLNNNVDILISLDNQLLFSFQTPKVIIMIDKKSSKIFN